ncbi:hypothetical protein GCM10008956_40560 [Deinococcus arenae]|uniref:Uncharacterized protein n=1 Tax=Deinococcus arenae TaxID=1452751 RepID=A0A8H9LAP3_9DEIO|nr:hypothetical protein [Deinococcus arenae]GGM60821.1 hypothetical protein GCM10008956_40560 [Deinococcus arenae]
MPRLGKKTLYLDLDALEKLEAALNRLPGRPSVSSYLSEQLPLMADSIAAMVDALEGKGLRGLANVFGVAADMEEQVKDEVKTTLKTSKKADKTLPELVSDIPPKKPRKPRAKKVDKA